MESGNSSNFIADSTAKTARRSNHKSRCQSQIKSTQIHAYKHSNFASSVIAKTLNTSSSLNNSRLYHTIPSIIEPDLDIFNIDYKQLIDDIKEFIPNNITSPFTTTKLKTNVTYSYHLIQHILSQPICNGAIFKGIFNTTCGSFNHAYFGSLIIICVSILTS